MVLRSMTYGFGFALAAAECSSITWHQLRPFQPHSTSRAVLCKQPTSCYACCCLLDWHPVPTSVGPPITPTRPTPPAAHNSIIKGMPAVAALLHFNFPFHWLLWMQSLCLCIHLSHAQASQPSTEAQHRCPALLTCHEAWNRSLWVLTCQTLPGAWRSRLRACCQSPCC